MLDNPTKFLIVSEEHGTFLGCPDGHTCKWSKKDGENLEDFPAFDDQYARRVIALNGMTENPDEVAGGRLLVRLVAVTPDKPGFRVTKAAMKAQALTIHGKAGKVTEEPTALADDEKAKKVKA